MQATASRVDHAAAAPLAERELVALWLLGRVPGCRPGSTPHRGLPGALLRPGRAGRGAGPDVREALFATPSGVPRAGDVEVHLRASDFYRHGHDRDAAYDRVLLHVVWEDDLDVPVRLAGGDRPQTLAVAATARDASRVRALLRRGPLGTPPCARADAAGTEEPEETSPRVLEAVRAQGRRRLAERVWRAARLAEHDGWEAAWLRLLDDSLRSSAGRRRESPQRREELVRAVTRTLAGCAGATTGAGPLPALVAIARERRPRPLIEALRDGNRLGASRAAEAGWNAALPLLAALAAAYDDACLGRGTAALADSWPAPRPYGRTLALSGLLSGPRRPARGAGALWAQGLLHVQQLWCERGGCGVCPLSPPGDS